MRMYNEALLARNPGATPQYSLNRIERTGSKDYPSWVYPANDWFKILFKDYSVNHRVGVNVRGGSETVQYYASVNYVNDQEFYTFIPYQPECEFKFRYPYVSQCQYKL